MIKHKTILCFASGYDAPPTSKHHVMHLLAEHNQVLWVNYHASRTPTASSSDLLYMAKKLGQVAAGLKNPRPNLHVLTPLVIPLPSSESAKKLNRTLLIKQIRRALRKVGNGPVQFWTFTPDVGYLLGSFNEEKTIYYCVDDHSQFTGYDVEQVLAEEEELCGRSDLVITTSMSLQKAKAGFNPNTVMVPHGVDHDHFTRAITDQNLVEPDDIAAIPHPRLGFFGLLRDWVDLDLVRDVAARRPEWHFVMVGDATFDLSPYQLPNIHFLGRKPYEDLPAYCKGFDVGLIPFKINELTLAVNPIKLREYLAAGLPVASTSLPEVALYEQFVELGNGLDEFEAAIQRCIDDRDEDQCQRRSTAMAEETWPEKVGNFERLLHPTSRPTAATE